MFKIAKSKIVKVVEQKLRDGDREGAMKLLREAEAADRTGALTKTLGASRPSSMIAGKLPTGTVPNSLKRVSSYVPAHVIQRMRALGYRSR